MLEYQYFRQKRDDLDPARPCPGALVLTIVKFEPFCLQQTIAFVEQMWAKKVVAIRKFSFFRKKIECRKKILQIIPRPINIGFSGWIWSDFIISSDLDYQSCAIVNWLRNNRFSRSEIRKLVFAMNIADIGLILKQMNTET